MSEEVSAEVSAEEAFMAILRRLHARWRLAILLPAMYFIFGLLIHAFVFQPRGRGILPLSETASVVGVFLGGAFVIFLWRLLRILQSRQLRKLAGTRDRNLFLAEARSGQLLQFSICDLASSPGIILFLLDGSVALLAAFLGVGMFFYLAAFPSGKKLGAAMFRPELIK